MIYCDSSFTAAEKPTVINEVCIQCIMQYLKHVFLEKQGGFMQFQIISSLSNMSTIRAKQE